MTVKVSSMNERDKAIIEAATRMFTRYGVKRTSMNDIAREAGISRQTLYNAFSNKDEVLQGAVRLFRESALTKIRSELPSAKTLNDKLYVIFVRIALDPYDQIEASPNSADIREGFNEMGQAVITETDVIYREVVEDVLAPYEGEFDRVGVTITAVASMVLNAAEGFKHRVRSRGELVGHLQTLSKTITAVARQSE